MKVNTYSAQGRKVGSTNLPKRFVEPENLDLLAQAIHVYGARNHPGLSKTKTRGEITASTRKVWRQKGTGRARHGAVSAPIFVGGGKAHGPVGVKRSLTLPKKMRQKALKVAMSIKAQNGEMVVVNGISTLKKTKDAAVLLHKIAEKGRFTVALSNEGFRTNLALRNLKNVTVFRFSDLNAYKVYLGGILIVDKDALEESTKRKTGSKKKQDTKQKHGKNQFKSAKKSV